MDLLQLLLVGPSLINGFPKVFVSFMNLVYSHFLRINFGFKIL